MNAALRQQYENAIRCGWINPLIPHFGMVSDYYTTPLLEQPEIQDIRAVTVKTAWDACGDWWWTEHFRLKIVGGRVLYWEATAAKGGQSVLLTRLEGGVTNTVVYQYRRYVYPYTPIVLMRYR